MRPNLPPARHARMTAMPLPLHTSQPVHLAALCGDLHMHHTGACEDMSDEEYLTALARVRAAVERWKPPSRPEVAPFDAAVYALCCAVLAEAVIHAARNITPTANPPERLWEDCVRDLGFTIVRSAEYPRVDFFRHSDKAIAAWWPNTGGTCPRADLTTPHDGPRCATGEDVLAWLKTM